MARAATVEFALPARPRFLHGGRSRLAPRPGGTDGKVVDLVPPGYINTDTRIALLSALHVKLPWATPFNVAGTALGTFTLVHPSSTADVAVSLPKINFVTESFDMGGALGALGMTQAFEPIADFGGFCANPPDGEHLSLSDVLHKATLSLEEMGVEAAAATAVIGGGGGAPVPTASIVFNRPFVISILDVPTGAVLFLGQITDPTDPGPDSLDVGSR